MRTAVLIAGALAAVAVVALLAVAVVAPVETEVRVGLISLAGVLFAALAGAAGVGLGSRLAAEATERAAKMGAEQAEKDREAAHRQRLSDRLTAIASDGLVAAERHRGAFWKQFHARSAVAAGKDRPQSIPDVLELDELLAAVGQLYIVGRQDTADAAWEVYRSLQSGLDQHVYDAAIHRRGDRVRRLTPDELTAINRADLDYQRCKTEFLSRVRVELGLDPLEPSHMPFPPEITPVGSAVHISGSPAPKRDPN